MPRVWFRDFFKARERWTKFYAQNKVSAMNQIIAAFMLVEGIAVGVLAYIMFRKKSAKLALCQRTWGEVIEFKESSGGEIATMHPVIRYTAINGETVIFESKFGSSKWKVKAGDRIEILYQPEQPH